MCDVSTDSMDDTAELAVAGAPAGVDLTMFRADVADERAMHEFAAHVRDRFDTKAIHLLFNNAGIAGGGSLVSGDREEWDRVFAVCFGGVLNGMRAFLPMLMAADRAHVVNTSSINGLWACLGPVGSHTAYSAAKFAVRGLTEALIVDFRVNAPHLTASVVMPGHIGTSIVRNSMILMGMNPKNLSEAGIDRIRQSFEVRGIDTSAASDEDIRALAQLRVDAFENDAPTTADEAAAIILNAVRTGQWRVLVGKDVHDIDQLLRERPADAYTDGFMDELDAMGHFGGLVQR